MKRLISLVGVLASLTLACGGATEVGAAPSTGAGATTTTAVAEPTGTTTPPSATPPTAPGGQTGDSTSPPATVPTTTVPPSPVPTTTVPPSPPPVWAQADLPAVDSMPGNPVSGRVVLVADDDVLNVRSGAGVDRPIVGKLAPRSVVALTGNTKTVGGSEWVEIFTPLGSGWVNRFYLGANVDMADFNSSDAVTALLDRMSEIMAAGGDLTEVASRRGLYIAHNAPLVRFAGEELPGLMTSSTTYQWGSAALEPGSPELPHRTFAAAVGDRFVSAYSDTDASILWNEVELGGNGTLPQYAIPLEFGAFNFVSVYDPGDDPQYEGLDWTAWYVSIDYEDGKPVVVGMTLNEWSP